MVPAQSSDSAPAQPPIIITEADLAGIPLGVPGVPGQPEIKLTLDQRTEMARRQKAEDRMRMSALTQQVEARLLEQLDEQQLRTISAVLDAAGGATGVLPTGSRRDRWELAWYSGRLAREGAYLRESRIPEGKAVYTYLVYEAAPASTQRWSESWPPIFLPEFSPAIDHGDMRRAPVPMLYEMRVDARPDGSMVFALLASMGGKEMLVSGIKVRSGEFAKVMVPGEHTIAIYAALRDQSASEKDHVRRMRAARERGQQALDDERIAIYTTPPPGFDPALGPPPEVVNQMRTTVRTESTIRALGARP
jgi:hypothetical protein